MTSCPTTDWASTRATLCPSAPPPTLSSCERVLLPMLFCTWHTLKQQRVNVDSSCWGLELQRCTPLFALMFKPQSPPITLAPHSCRDEHYGELTVRETFQFSSRVQGGRRGELGRGQ